MSNKTTITEISLNTLDFSSIILTAMARVQFTVVGTPAEFKCGGPSVKTNLGYDSSLFSSLLFSSLLFSSLLVLTKNAKIFRKLREANVSAKFVSSLCVLWKPRGYLHCRSPLNPALTNV
jgi:hypothetical protein